MFRVEYGREHPVIVAAREFVRKSMAGFRAREAARRAEQEFQKLIEIEEEQQGELPENLLLDIEEELLPLSEIPWEEEETMIRPRDVSRREAPYEYSPFEPEELERFFDVERYPVRPISPLRGPPPGRELLPPELWELEDPWIWGAQPDISDLIRFESP